jgi:magnesium-transporting ATPase (P-type)
MISTIAQLPACIDVRSCGARAVAAAASRLSPVSASGRPSGPPPGRADAPDADAAAPPLGERDVDLATRAEVLLHELRSSPQGLSSAEAARRLLQYGPNELRRRGGRRWPRELARQLTHPLALLLWVAAGLSFAFGSETVAIAVLLVIALNAGFAFVQELEAERAVEALAAYMPQHVRVLRDAMPTVIDATQLVAGDVVLLAEGDRVPADARLLSGALEIDLSTLTGESLPVARSAGSGDTRLPRLRAKDLVFSGASCTGGEATGVVVATGMRTELGRIAALSERVKEAPSPLERQVRRVAWLIAAIAVTMAVGFVPLAIFGAGLSLHQSVVFAVGLLAGNVPEGLLPVITLSLAVAVAALARRGALVKRLSAVETLGSTDVICTDKTGTLTENRMRPVAAWTPSAQVDLAAAAVSAAGGEARSGERPSLDRSVEALAATAAACNNASLGDGADGAGEAAGDPTEIAVLLAARSLGADPDPGLRERRRRAHFHFDPALKLMSTLDLASPTATAEDEAARGTRPAAGAAARRAAHAPLVLHTKGAPEAILPRCERLLGPDGAQRPLDSRLRARIATQVESFAAAGMRVLAFARRELDAPVPPEARAQAERELCFLGLIAMLDPPRAEVADAVAACHSAGIRIIVISGDHPLTAAAIARQVGIGGKDARGFDASDLDHRSAQDLRRLLEGDEEIVFARASPEAKLHIAEALRARGATIAMTGDGVNDAPALRCADIGVAMGRSGTDVAREAATMVLTDDNFATIVVAIDAGRRVYENVRKFIVYIFAHATPEVVPFLVFALAGGLIPLPVTILQVLAFDVGTETLPSLALSREPAEPGLMQRPPRPREEGVIRAPMLVRAWLFLGALVAALSMGGFFYVLARAGWSPGDHVGAGSGLHHAYLQATTMTFLGMVAGQIGTAFAVRSGRASLRTVGVLSNRYLLAAVAGELALAALFVYAPPLQGLLGTAALPARYLVLLLPYPFIVWGADELRRYVVRRSARPAGGPSRAVPA